MALNKDQFGPPSNVVFHGSSVSSDEFMRAPLLHVGSRAAADEMTKAHRGHTVTLHFSQFAEVHPERLTDEDANEAHRQFAEARNFPVEQGIKDSSLYRQRVHTYVPGEIDSTVREVPVYDDDEHKNKIQRAVAALGENKILQYENSVEDKGSTSYIVPSPHMNMREPGTADPQKQPVLPMDYSGVSLSERTKAFRGLPSSYVDQRAARGGSDSFIM